MRSAARPLAIRASTKVPARSRRWNTTTTLNPQTSQTEPLRSILIANRGEIALRVGRTAAEQGIRTTTLYTDPDKRSQHALSSPFALNLGSETNQYLNGQRIIELAKEHGCQAIHPGYGFLSENAGFAKQCEEAGLRFIGPGWKAIEAMGDKARSKEIMEKAGVPCIPGYHGVEQDPEHLKTQAEGIGFPVLIKAVKGGGGKGMRIVQSEKELLQLLESAKSEARSSFGDDVMLVEKYITKPRHIEVQIFADSHGNCLALGERDCSLQRRHQKILEESPAPNLPDHIRKDLWSKAREVASAVGYMGAGTVEFIFDNETKEYFFMEMNTRLQVEHPVTEMTTGLDLVAWQIAMAEGKRLPLTQEEVEARIAERGHAIEARIYAEDPAKNFLPSTGKLVHLRTPRETESVRIDAGFVEGDEVSSHYDPMIAKLIVSAPTRTAALQKLERALEEYEVAGLETNIEFLKRCCSSPAFVAGEVETGYIQKYHDELFNIERVPEEVYIQAAIGLYQSEQSPAESPFQSLGFTPLLQPRVFQFSETSSDPESTVTSPTTVAVNVLKTGPETLSVTLGVNEGTPQTVTTTFSPTNKSLRTFFPHTRLETTLIRDPEEPSALTLFQQGKRFRLNLSPPAFLAKALGEKDVANSVLAPMPCKILRVEVEAGDEVVKGQALVVIESMKMETVIRSPQDGRVERVVHKVGDLCKAGTALVEFESGE